MEEIERLRSEFRDRYGNRYRIDREIGRGGMATVYLARDTRYERDVAIKVLDRELASLVGVERFLQEIQLAAGLEHPGIVSLRESGGSGGFLFYVMPYYQDSLRALLHRKGPLSLVEAVEIAREVADALAYAHQQGFVHRDIKPENILLHAGHAFVADFGIARAIVEAGDQRWTKSGHSVGSPLYMSPEQVLGDRNIDGRADVYALSCVLYEMLTGRPPITGKSAQEILTKQILELPAPLQAIAPHVPPSVATAVERGLAKDRFDRFDTAAQFRTSLELPIPARMPSPGLSKRIRWVVRLAAVTVAAVAAIAGWQVLTNRIPTLDANRVVVFPPIDQGNGRDIAGVSRAVAVAVEVALDHAEPLKWVDGWDRLPELARRDPVLLTADLARAIAIDRRARYYIKGILAGREDSLLVLLTLHDVAADTFVERAAASGHRDSTTLESLSLLAMVELLPSIVRPGPEWFLPALAGRKPSAVALSMQGEREYRRSHFADALDLYERALHEDSLMALAALKGALAASWLHDDGRAKALIEIANSLDEFLPTRYANLARGIEAFFYGRADAAVAYHRAALSADSLWVEPLMELGEVYYHLLPSELHVDLLAEAAFERAASLDTAFTPALFHLSEIRLARGDWRGANPLISSLSSVNFNESSLLQLRLLRDCVREGPESVKWREMTEADPDAVLNAAKISSAAAAQSVCAEHGFRAVLDDQRDLRGHKWLAALGLQGLLIAQGRNTEALVLLDSIESSGVSLTKLLYVFDVFAGAPFEGEASGVAAYAAKEFGVDYENSGSLLQWMMAAWHARSGELDKAERILSAVEALADRGTRRDSLRARSLRGHVALARGDTAEAITRFDTLRPTAPRDSLLYRFSEPLAIEKMLLAKLLLAQGMHQRAHDVAAIFDHFQPVMFLPFLAQSLGIRLEAAEALGRGNVADRYRKRLEALGRSDLLRRVSESEAS